MRQLVQNANSLSIGKLSQNQIKIGSGSGSNVGIYFNNGNENLPGIKFQKESLSGVNVSNTTNVTYNGQSYNINNFWAIEDITQTGDDRVYTLTVNGLTFYLFFFINSSYGKAWVISTTKTPITGPTTFLSQTFYANANSGSNPWDLDLVWSKGTGGSASELPIITEQPAQESQWQYSNDGSNWFSIKPSKSSIDLSYELISIISSDLVDGIATIKHNLGKKYVLGLDYTVTPDNIEYIDENTLTIDYSKHLEENSSENLGSNLIISNAGTAEINQKYIFTTEGTYYDMAGSAKNCADTPNGGVWFSEDNNFVLFARNVSSGFEYDIVDNNNYTKTPYYASSQPYITDSSKMPWDVEWMKSAKGADPVPMFNKQTAEVEISKIWFIGSKQDMLQR